MNGESVILEADRKLIFGEGGISVINLIAFAGSTRRESFNRKLVRIAAKGAEQNGAAVEVLELSDFPMPLLNEDLEAESGMPPGAAAFKRKIMDSHGFMISAPEYNGSFSPLLKNALDWCSRSQSANAKPLSAFRGKTAVLMSASPGSLGGMRGLVPLRMLLGNLGVLVIPGFRCISSAGDAFTENGLLKNSRDQKAVMKLGADLVSTAERMKNG